MLGRGVEHSRVNWILVASQEARSRWESGFDFGLDFAASAALSASIRAFLTSFLRFSTGETSFRASA